MTGRQRDRENPTDVAGLIEDLEDLDEGAEDSTPPTPRRRSSGASSSASR